MDKTAATAIAVLGAVLVAHFVIEAREAAEPEPAFRWTDANRWEK